MILNRGGKPERIRGAEAERPEIRRLVVSGRVSVVQQIIDYLRKLDDMLSVQVDYVADTKSAGRNVSTAATGSVNSTS